MTFDVYLSGGDKVHIRASGLHEAKQLRKGVSLTSWNLLGYPVKSSHLGSGGAKAGP